MVVDLDRVEKAVNASFKALKSEGDKQDRRYMFGGHCFVVNGNMLGGMMGTGELCLRLDKPTVAEILGNEPHASPMDFTGKVLSTMVYIDQAGWTSERDLRKWTDLAVSFALKLPKKAKKAASVASGGKKAAHKGGGNGGDKAKALAGKRRSAPAEVEARGRRRRA